MEPLRLFPLRTVLFPGMELSLAVFEDRYKQLVGECVETGEPFGVALIREGAEVGGPATPFDLGTIARIQSVVPVGGGRLQMESIGERRFRISELHDDRPYLTADVAFPADEAAEIAGERLEDVRSRYQQIVRLRLRAAGEYRHTVPLPRSPATLADLVGGLQLASPEQQQRLLEELNVARRLDLAAERLEEALPHVRRATASAVAARYGGTGALN